MFMRSLNYFELNCNSLGLLGGVQDEAAKGWFEVFAAQANTYPRFNSSLPRPLAI